MKNVLIALTLLVVGVLFAQEIPQNKVPKIVVDSFQSKFPNASDIEWKKDKENYKVEFELGVFMLTNDHDVWFDMTGNILKHKEDITKTDLPEKVLAKISSDFKDYRVEDTKKTTEKNAVFYEVELKKHKSELKVTFDENGTILSKKED